MAEVNGVSPALYMKLKSCTFLYWQTSVYRTFSSLELKEDKKAAFGRAAFVQGIKNDSSLGEGLV